MLKVKGQKKIPHANLVKRDQGRYSYKRENRLHQKLSRYKGHYMIEESILQEDITINIYTSKITAFKYIKQTSTELKRERQ